MKISFPNSRSMTWAEMLKNGDFGGIADWFIERFVLFGVLAIIGAAIAAYLDKGATVGMRVLALSMIFGAASTAAGWLLGLLFGVPRTLARAQAATPANGATPAREERQGGDGQSASRVNTNLEDISDWLTKTIVGVGLTQLYSVPHFLWSSAHKVNAAGFGWNPYGQLLAVALFIYFACGGFWLGYVGTRTVLTKLLKQIDSEADRQDVKEAVRAGGLQISLTGQSIEPAADPELQKADKAILALSRDALKLPQEIAAWGAAQARAGNLTAAKTALESAHSAEPANSDIRQLLAKVYSVLGMRVEAERLGQDAPKSEIDVLNALYDEPPAGFERAIVIAEELAKKEGLTKGARLHMYLACAYGQKYGYMKVELKSPAEELAKVKERVVREIEIAIAADPETRVVLHGAWKPARGAEDNDLTGFEIDDPDLTRLLEPGSSQSPPPQQPAN